VAASLLDEPASEKPQLVLRSILTSLGQIRYRQTELLDKVIVSLGRKVIGLIYIT
jgi:hypothetical protein